MKTIKGRSPSYRGRCLLAAGVGSFGAFLLVAGLVRPDLAWLFGILGFACLVLGTSRALACWNVDSLVFDDRRTRKAPARDRKAA